MDKKSKGNEKMKLMMRINVKKE